MSAPKPPLFTFAWCTHCLHLGPHPVSETPRLWRWTCVGCGEVSELPKREVSAAVADAQNELFLGGGEC